MGTEPFLATMVIVILLSLLPSTKAFVSTTTTGISATLPGQWNKRDTRFSMTARPNVGDDNGDGDEDDDDAPPRSYELKKRNPYDVHVYYDGAAERAAAMELRSKLMAEFGDWMRFYPPRGVPIGPHPVPMWEADFGSYDNRHRWVEVRDFLVRENTNENNNESNAQTKPKTQTKTTQLSILIHPHSTDGDYADHTRNAFWIGRVLDLKIGGWNRN